MFSILGLDQHIFMIVVLSGLILKRFKLFARHSLVKHRSSVGSLAFVVKQTNLFPEKNVPVEFFGNIENAA